MGFLIALLVKHIYASIVRRHIRRAVTAQPRPLTAIGLLALQLM